LLAVRGRSAGEVACEFERRGVLGSVSAHRAAAVTLDRLRNAGLVYVARTANGGEILRITARGRAELALRRRLAATVVNITLGAATAAGS
jgi:hypothetical protein